MSNLGTITYTAEIETAKLVTGTTQAERQLDKLDTSMSKADASSKTFTSTLSKLSGAIAAVVAANALRDMADLVQKYQEMSERVQMATASQAEFEMVQKRLLSTANATYRSLGEAQELYIRTADSLRSMGYSTSQALDVTDSLSFAFVKNATSADRASGAIAALSKSVNKGKVEADAWETVIAAVPSVIEDIALSSGKTAAQVRALGAAGKLTAKDLTEGLRKSLDENAKAAAAMSNNLVDASVRTKTALTAVLVEIENQTGGLQALTDGIIGAADAMLSFGGDSEKVATFLNLATTAATSLAAVIAGRLVGATLGYVAAQGLVIKNMVTQISGAAAVAGANLMLAKAENAAAQAALAQAVAAEKAAIGLQTHAAQATVLSAAQARAATATAGLSTAIAASTSVATASTVAMGALRTAMTFLGGPAGVIFLAAAALVYFASSAKTTKVDVDALNSSLGKLGFYQLAKSANDTQDDIAKLNKQLSAAMNDFNTLSKRPFESDDSFVKRQTEARAELERVNEELKARRDLLDNISKRQEEIAKPKEQPKTGSPEGLPPATTSEEGQKAIENLKEQLALAKLTGEAKAKLQAIQKLGAAATEQEKAEAASLGAEIYKLETATKALGASNKKQKTEAEQLAKRAAAAEKKELEDTQKVYADYGEALAAVGQSARALAMDEAELKLSRAKAIPTAQDIKLVRDLAAAQYDATQGKQLVSQFDPIAGENDSYLKKQADLEIANQVYVNGQKLLSEQSYLEAKKALEVEHTETLMGLEAQRFAAQSAGNAAIMAGLEALNTSGTQALAGLLSGTMSLRDAMGNIANTVLNSVIGSFVQMGTDWVKQELVMMAATKAKEAATIGGIGAVTAAQAGATGAIAATTTATAATTGTAVAGSMAPAAGLSSIASFGGAAVIGGAALLATMALAKTAGGRQYGGGVAAGGMYRVNETGAPEIFNAANGRQYMMPNTRGEVVSNKDATSGGGGSAAPIVNVNNYSGQQATASSKFSESDRTWVIDVVVGDMQGGGKTAQTTNQITGTQRAGR